MIENLKEVVLTYEDREFKINGESCNYDKLFGCPYVFNGSIESGIIMSDHIYTDKTNMFEILEFIGVVHETEDYDEIKSMGRGSTRDTVTRNLLGDSPSLVIQNVYSFKDIEIKPLSDFKKQFPDYNEHNYFLVMDGFDEFYSFK